MNFFDKYLNLAQASEMTGYHSDYIGALIRSGKVRGKREGKNWLVSKRDLKAHLTKKHFVSTAFFKIEILVLLTLLLIVIGILFYSDRTSVRREVLEDREAKRALSDSAYSVNLDRSQYQRDE